MRFPAMRARWRVPALIEPRHIPKRTEEAPLKLVHPERHASFLEHAQRQLIGIRIGVDDLGDTGVDAHLGAGYARLRGDVDLRAADIDAIARSLNDRVLFGVQAPADLLALTGPS